MMVCIIYVPNMYTQITFVIFHQSQDGCHCAKIPYKRYSTVPCVFSFIIFGDLENYTFLETLGPTEPEKLCIHFFPSILWPPSWIFKMTTDLSEIWQYLSF